MYIHAHALLQKYVHLQIVNARISSGLERKRVKIFQDRQSDRLMRGLRGKKCQTE